MNQKNTKEARVENLKLTQANRKKYLRLIIVLIAWLAALKAFSLLYERGSIDNITHK